MTEVDRTGRTVVGFFRDRHRAEEAIRDLQVSGFPGDRIGLAIQDSGAATLTGETGFPAAEGAVQGVVSGGVVGGLLGLLGSLLVPGLGPIVVGGVLASALTGAGIGAATGGLIGALRALGVPEDDARQFDLALRAGGALVTVDAGSRTGEALAIMQRHEVDLGPGGPASYELAHPRRVDSSAPGAMSERRRLADPSYAGPERRLIGV
ncbi:MAG TPA: hypothetical protein VFI77_08765 [Gemmatimonadales bacterium]|nr:hypothetical protein [Gemmatimonadales bacterium]